MSIKSINSSLIESTTIPSLEDLCKEALFEHLKQDIATLRSHPHLTLDEALEFVGRKAEYRKIFKQDIHRNSFLEYANQVKALRQNYLPLRAVDAIRFGMKQGIKYEWPPSLLNYRPKVQEPHAIKEALKKLEAQFIQQAKEHEEVVSIAQRISCLHGTNSSLFALIDASDYTMYPTGKLLDRGIAVMSGEISKGGMTKIGVNQYGLSCDTIEAISRCWQYASEISHSFKAPSNEQYIEQFTEDLERLKKTSPDDDLWDPLLISFLRLKQWNPKMFETLCEEHLKGIEEIKKNIFSKASYEEMLILKALDYPLEKLLQAASDAELRKAIDKEFDASGYLQYAETYTLNSDASIYLLGWACIESQKYLKKFLSPSHAATLEMIDRIFQFRINAAQLLETYSLMQQNPDKYQKNMFIGFVKNFNLTAISSSLDPEEILQKMIRDKIQIRIQQNMKPFEKRYQRFLDIFNPAKPVISIDDTRQHILAHPYSMLLASSKIKPVKYSAEYIFPKAKLGSEIDMIFVPKKHIEDTRAWLKTHHLDKQIQVYPEDLVKEIEQLPLPVLHSPIQVIDYQPSLDMEQQKKLNEILNKYVFPLYAQPYPDGSNREHHGIPHAVRVVLFSICLMELYHAAGKKVKTQSGNLQVAAGLHDCARKNDGVDLWDKESGQACASILKELDQSNSEANFLARCIAEKDMPTDDIEHRIIYDADCLEIIRCLRNPRDFDKSKLWSMKDLDPDTVLKLIKEAEEFIKLTEQPAIKRFLSTSKEPYKALLQILFISRERFTLMYSLNVKGVDSLSAPSDYILPQEVESLCLSSDQLESRRKHCEVFREIAHMPLTVGNLIFDYME